MDREEGGKEKLAKNGIQLTTLLKISEVAKILYDVGSLDEESFKTIMKQVKKNKNN
jgi:orotate phosphoribosyltransferase